MANVVWLVEDSLSTVTSSLSDEVAIDVACQDRAPVVIPTKLTSTPNHRYRMQFLPGHLQHNPTLPT